MMNVLSPAGGLVLLLIFGLAFFVAATYGQRVHGQTKASFFAANRDLGWVRSGFSIAATWIWAPALFVAAEQGYKHGWVGVAWFTVPNVACLMIFAWFARRARSRYPEGFTLSAMARQSYSPRVQKAYLVALSGLSVASIAVQVLAGAVVVTAVTGVPFGVVAVLLTTMALSYTVLTGLRGSVVTDWLQMSVLLVVGIGLALAVAFAAGWGTLSRGLTGADGAYTSLTSGAGAGVFWSFGLSTTVGLLAGPFGDQSFWQRAWSVRAGGVGKSFVLGGAVFAVIPVVMALLGFAAAGRHLTVANTTLTNLAAVLHWLPAWTAVPFLLYVFSGLVSTMSSQLSALSSFAGHDFSRTSSDAVSVRRGRSVMVGSALLALAIALAPGLTVVELFIFYGTLRACTLVPTILMLTLRRPLHEGSAFYGILASLAIALPLSAYGNLSGTTWAIVAASLAAIGVSGTITLCGALVAGREPQAVGERA